MEPSPLRTALDRHRKLNVSLASLAVALLAACAYFALRGPARGPSSIGMAMTDAELKARVVEELVRTGQGIFDSHVDPVVGRVLQPNLREREFQGASISTNWFGLRERSWQQPKPEGVTRVVLLGDSFVFGEGAEEDERVSRQLERLIADQTKRPQWAVEVLAIAVPSWNIEAECAYLRRAMDSVEPDAVLQISCSNDLDDVEGTRGFGSRSRVPTNYVHRGDGRLAYCHPNWYLLAENTNRLIWGLDWQSQDYYRRARESIEALARDLGARRASYVHVYHWSSWNAIARRNLQGALPDEQQAMIPEDFYKDPSTWIGPRDQHWNALGAERVAKLLYVLLRARRLLPQVELPPLGQDEELALQVWNLGEQERPERENAEHFASWQEFGSALDTRAWTEYTKTLVHGGIDLEGMVSPYASVALCNVVGGDLRVAGRCLDTATLDGKLVRVFVDEALVGEIRLARGAAIDARFVVPEPQRARRFLSARFESDDWIYVGEELQHTIVFQLHTLAVEVAAPESSAIEASAAELDAPAR
jgi:hypothetical protein